MMGGDIELNSVLGNGSLFAFQIDFPLLDRSNLPSRNVPETIDTGLYTHFPLRILVVDDNMVNRKVAQMLLRKMGYRPDLAENAEEALDKIRKGRYEVIFMDILMPQMDGFEASRKIRNMDDLDPSPVIVALSGKSAGDDLVRCQQAGMDLHLDKPIRASQLKQTLIDSYQKSNSKHYPHSAPPS